MWLPEWWGEVMEAVECRWRAAMRLGSLQGYGTLSLASDLILLVHSQGGVLCKDFLEESGVLWGGPVWAGMCVSAAMMSWPRA